MKTSQAISPNTEAMYAHVDRLFGDAPDGRVELAWTGTGSSICHAQQFTLDRLEHLVFRAEQEIRCDGVNVFIGASLRSEDTDFNSRAGDNSFHAAPAYWADLDEPGAAAKVRQRSGQTPPTLAVITGRYPRPRVQLYWKPEVLIRNATALRRRNLAIARALDGDQSVVNPGRVLRLAGSIAWPHKPGRRLEVSALALSFPYEALNEMVKPLNYGIDSSLPERWVAVVRDGASAGKRNTTAVALAGHLLRKDIHADVAQEFLSLWNQYRCRPPLGEHELGALFNSICRRELTRRGAA